MTTKEAFEKLIFARGCYKKLGIEQKTVGALRNNFKKGKVSLDRMEELLLKAGYIKKPEVWKKY